MSDFKVPEGWTTGHHDGYYTKIIKVGNSTIEINRPFLTKEERKKREEAVEKALVVFGREVLSSNPDWSPQSCETAEQVTARDI